jgi:excisionase family DNA binding protein
MSRIEETSSRSGSTGQAQRIVLTVSELAQHLKIHPTTVYRLIKKQGLPGFKIGSDWRFNIEAIDRWCSKAVEQNINNSDQTKEAPLGEAKEI